MSRDESEWLRGNGKAALCHNHVWNEKKRKKANNGSFISSESRASNKIVIIAGTKRKKRSTRSTRFTVSLNRKQKYLFFTCHFCPTNRHFFFVACSTPIPTNVNLFMLLFFDYHSNVLLYMICLWLFGDRPRQRSWRLHYPRWPWSGVVKPQMCYRRNIQHSKWPLTDESLGRNRKIIYWASSPQKPAYGVSVPIEIHSNYTLASIVCVCIPK